MKKTNLIRCLKILALALPILLFVLFSQQYLFYYSDHNAERIRRFYQEEENSLDVVFLGASDVFSGFVPALAYEEYGITSYCYAIDANPGDLLPYQLKEVLSTQDPQVILVEINGFMYDQPVEEERLQIFAENIPLSANKLEAVFRFQEADRLSTLLPFTKYHGDWEKGSGLVGQLKWRLSTAQNPSLLKGIITCTTVDERLPEEIRLSEEQKASMQMAERSLEEFMAFCRQEELENVVFVRFPHKTADQQKELVERIGNTVQQQGFAFLNLEEQKDAMGLDARKDYYNSEHLNIYGQRKLTNYLGNILTNTFRVEPTVQSEKNRAHWETCVDYYHGFYDYAQEKILAGDEEWPCEDQLTFPRLQEWMQEQKQAQGA